MSHLPTLGGPCGPPIPFPTAASSHLRIAGFRPRPIAHGTISQHISILYNGPEVEVLCPRSGSRLAAWSFAIDDERRSGVKSSRDENDVFGTAATEVTCVAFLEHKIRPGLTNARRFVVVGTSNGIVGVIDICAIFQQQLSHLSIPIPSGHYQCSLFDPINVIDISASCNERHNCQEWL